jgi:hypothetical protein
VSITYQKIHNNLGCFVGRSWNIAASDDHLWQLQYASVFSNSDNCLKSKGHQIGRPVEDEEFRFLEHMDTRSSIDWREAFKRAYIGMWIQNHLIYVLTANHQYG